MLVIAMLLLHRARKHPALIQFVSLPLATAYLIRPIASIPIVVLTSYVLAKYPTWWLRYLLWSMLIGVPWIAFNLAIYGAILPPYYLGLSYAGESSFSAALLGNLVSPSRGMFTYSPVLLFALTGFVFALRETEGRLLYLAYGAIVIGMLIAISLIPAWWAGHSYGPRVYHRLRSVLGLLHGFQLSCAGRIHPQTARRLVDRHQRTSCDKPRDLRAGCAPKRPDGLERPASQRRPKSFADMGLG